MSTLLIRNQTCHLLAEAAVFWEEQKTLILADMHLGKEAVFQKAGIPIHQGILEDDLMRLARCIKRVQAKRCIIVGDLIHAKSGLTENVTRRVSQWLHQVGVEVHLVAGNHDRVLLQALPSSWPITMHTDGFAEGPFYFSHHPRHHPKGFVFAGHIHPKCEIGNQHDSLVLRCFQIFSDLAILPAFGFFIGGTLVRKSEACKIYVIADEQVIEV